VSQSTRDLLPSEPLRDLGTHRLKDLTAPERIYQVGDRKFSALKTLDRTNLPVTATPLVGRRRELDELAALVDWSLVKPVGDGRFLILETIREYARELMAASADFAELRRRHADYVLALVEAAEPELTGPKQREWYERLAAEQANVREALTYACDSNDRERALMIRERSGGSDGPQSGR
jgi:hypothetical protein